MASVAPASPLPCCYFVVESTGASFPVGLERLGLAPGVEAQQEVRPLILCVSLVRDATSICQRKFIFQFLRLREVAVWPVLHRAARPEPLALIHEVHVMRPQPKTTVTTVR